MAGIGRRWGVASGCLGVLDGEQHLAQLRPGALASARSSGRGLA